MILTILKTINELNERFFLPFDTLISKMPFDEWVIDAITDSFHLLPFLFLIFVIIEFIEFYFSDKIFDLMQKNKKRSVLISSFAAIFPQCGFSVIASSLYSKRIITKGCLIAVYLATSDECLPILLSNPDKIYLVVPVVAIKFVAAVIVGYLVDIIFHKFGDNKNISENIDIHEEHITETGCCSHYLECKNTRELVLHPIMHTLNIFAFILTITLMLNYLFEHLSFADFLTKNINAFAMCVSSAILGLIPNCAVSVTLTMLLIKGKITFGAAMSGLLSNGGLGLLVLLKNNNFKDNLIIISILLAASIFFGVVTDLIFINIRLN